MPTPESAYLLWISQGAGIYNFGQLEGGWICVYVPGGLTQTALF